MAPDEQPGPVDATPPPIAPPLAPGEPDARTLPAVAPTTDAPPVAGPRALTPWLEVFYGFIVQFWSIAAQTLAALLVIPFLSGSPYDHLGLILTISAWLQTPVMLGVCVLLLRRHGLNWREHLHLRPLTRGGVVACVAIMLGYLVLELAASVFIDEPPAEFMVALGGTPWFLVPPLMVGVVLLAPLTEEIVFRGLLLQGLRRTWLGALGALLVTSALFSLIHAAQYGLVQLVSMFALGLLLGVLRLAGGSLTLAILLHSLNNTVAMAMLAMHLGSPEG
jgi:membrane protease YdiL (CAAX protease family)